MRAKCQELSIQANKIDCILSSSEYLLSHIFQVVTILAFSISTEPTPCVFMRYKILFVYKGDVNRIYIFQSRKSFFLVEKHDLHTMKLNRRPILNSDVPERGPERLTTT